MSTAKSLYALRVIWTLRGATPLDENPPQIWPESSRNHEKHDFQGLAKPGFTCKGRPCLPHISSYKLPQKLRLIPSDAKSHKVSGKIRRSQNELTDSEKIENYDMKSANRSVNGKSPTSSALHPNYSIRAPLKLKCSTSHLISFSRFRAGFDSSRAVNRQPGYRPGDS